MQEVVARGPLSGGGESDLDHLVAGVNAGGVELLRQALGYRKLLRDDYRPVYAVIARQSLVALRDHTAVVHHGEDVRVAGILGGVTVAAEYCVPLDAVGDSRE